MITAFNATTSAAIAVPANIKRVALIFQNVSDTDIFVKFDNSTTVLTTANGFKLEPAGTLSFATKDTQCFDPVYVIHGGAGNKEIRVQEFERV